MFNQFLNKVQQLYGKRESFAIAFVVNRQQPSSGKPGDKAVIEIDGTITGWIGGGCTRGIVLKEAGAAIRDGKPRMVSINPEANNPAKAGVIDYKMTCQSGGAVDIYIEPVLPRPSILIMGKSHVAMALSRIAKAMDYPVAVYARDTPANAFPDADHIIDEPLQPEAVGPNSCIVICTQGQNDEEALEQALRTSSPYLAFVASRRKANAVFRNMKERGFEFDRLKDVRTPAGLDINAKLPEEVAISILAEIVATIRDQDHIADNPKSAEAGMPGADLYINPVCGIPVDKKNAKHVVEYNGNNFYFCCDGCKDTFEKNPTQYSLSQHGTT